jgi:hypothetical protein|tara:strand:+ start:476 stop:991 length:516 start_codon:yes stop_codon:yes gene_type:complete
MKSIILKQHDILALKEGRKTQHRGVVKFNKRLVKDFFDDKSASESSPYKIGELVKVNELIAGTFGCKKTPANFVKRAFSLTLEITGVRVERVQDISEQDAILEGVESWLDFLPNDFRKLRGILCDNYHAIQYRQMWQSINGKDSWEANPWVWVLDFIAHNKNIDEVINEKA